MPEELFEALQKLAQREHRSINGQILYEIERATGVRGAPDIAIEGRLVGEAKAPGKPQEGP
jgi:hypothetical protein